MAEERLPSSRQKTSEAFIGSFQDVEQYASNSESSGEGHQPASIRATTTLINTTGDISARKSLPGLNSSGFIGFLNKGPRESFQRPASLKKLRRRPSHQLEQISAELRPVLHLFDVFSRKIYIEGYICKQDQTSDETRPNAEGWAEFYAELCGPVLSIWKLNTNSEISEVVTPNPTLINISNSSIEIIGTVLDGISQRENLFLLDIDDGIRYYFQAANSRLLNQWILAIRLSCFEGSRLQEIYTATLFRRQGFKEFLTGTPLIKGKLEGYLQVRFNGCKESKKYWVVVADHRLEDKKKKDIAFTRGQAAFYETNKSKKPFMTLANVLQTYAIYPENPSLIDKTNLFRVEGNFFPAKPTDKKSGDFVNLTTESSSEMAKWVIAFFDAFKLHGRPKDFPYDFKDPDSPLFAVPVVKSDPKLFLDMPDVQHVNIRESLADVKAEFAEVLKRSYQQRQDQYTDPNLENEVGDSRHQKKSDGTLPSKIMANGLPENSTRQRAFSNESGSSTPSSGSSNSLKNTLQLTRPISYMQTNSQGERRTSITPLSPNLIPAPQNPRKAGTGRHQVASSDEDDEVDEENHKETETETESEVDDHTLLKNTQANAKITPAEAKIELITEQNLPQTQDTLVNESIQLNSASNEGSNDLMAEIMTVMDDRKIDDNDVQASKTSKPKRSVSFKNPPKLKYKSKKQVTPLPSDSEEEKDSGGEQASHTADINSMDELKDSVEDIKTKKMKAVPIKTTSPPLSQISVNSPASSNSVGKGKNKKLKMVPQPSDSSEESDVKDDHEKEFVGIQLQPSSRPRLRELPLRQEYETVLEERYDGGRPYYGEYRQNLTYGQYGYLPPKVPYMERGAPYSPKIPNYPYISDRNNLSYPGYSSPGRARFTKEENGIPYVDDHNISIPRAPGRSRKSVPGYPFPVEEIPKISSKVQKPIKRASLIAGSAEESTETEEEDNTASETEEGNNGQISRTYVKSNPSSVSKKNEPRRKSNTVAPEDKNFELPDVSLDVDFSSLNLEWASRNINDSNEQNRKEKPAITTNEESESQLSESEEEPENLMNQPRRVFKPTKQKDKVAAKLKTRHRNSSEGSSSNSSMSHSSSHEPLVTLIAVPEDGGTLNHVPPFIRSHSNTPPRSLSPNNSPYWENEYMMDSRLPFGYSLGENRRSMLMPPRDYHDDDRTNLLGTMGPRPRSVVSNPTGRRRISGGQAEYMREQRDSYYEDDYYEERGESFQPRPRSLLGVLPQHQLSAREQEYLARETGSPLIQLEARQKDPQFGLVGAITARERQRKVLGPAISGRQLEIERDALLERERERRLFEQRQQSGVAERDNLYGRQYGPPSPIGPDPRASRYYINQQYLDTGSGPNSRRGSYYENYNSGSYEEDYDEDDDIPLAIVPQPPLPRQMRGGRVGVPRRKDNE
ncbi:hypothetical protein G9A89_004220 [Geosiphon pyriformis]|nr:hypothetical protein G9A89_004220 [Geosiphon pyriformis]